MTAASRAATLALAVVLPACAKDLELPPASTAPVLTSLTPARAWAGQLVRVEGTGLDPDPTANVVTFAGATARGLGFEGPALVVRVPADAGSGPVTLANGRGTSDPFGSLDYLGLGEPRRRAVATRRPVLHRPLGIHGVGGDVFVHSSLYGGLLAASDPGFVTGAALLTAAAPWNGSLYHTRFDAQTRTTYLRHLDAAGAVLGEVVLPFAPTQLVAMRGVDLVVAFGTDGGVDALAAWGLGLGAPRIPSTPLGVGAFFGAADLGDGRAAVVAYDAGFTTLTLAVVDVQAALSGPLPAPAFLPGSPETFALTSAGLVGLAVAGAGTATPRVALTLDGGDLAVADVGAAPGFTGTVKTFSRSAVEGLAGAATVPVVLATKPDDGLAVGVDLAARTLRWSTPGDAPTVAAADGDVAWVADRATNDVSVVNLATGFRIARLSLDVAPGAPGAGRYGGAAAFLARDPVDAASEDELFFPASRFPGLVRFPLGAGEASVVSRTPGIALVCAVPSPPALWAASEPGAVDVFQDRAWGAPVSRPLSGPPLRAAAAGTRLALLHDAVSPRPPGLEVLEGSTPSGSAPIPGATAFHGLGFLPDGRIWTVLALPTGERVQLWDPAHVATAGAPDADVPVAASGVTAALLLEDGLWILSRESSGPRGLLLGPDLAAARTVALASDVPAVHAVSPNGRVLVERVLGGAAGETLLRFYRADPDAGFPEIDGVVVEGNVEGLAFDETGERLWIVTRGPDRVVLVD